MTDGSLEKHVVRYNYQMVRWLIDNQKSRVPLWQSALLFLGWLSFTMSLALFLTVFTMYSLKSCREDIKQIMQAVDQARINYIVRYTEDICRHYMNQQFEKYHCDTVNKTTFFDNANS